MAECYTYLMCPEEVTNVFVEMGCISSESVSHTLQTSNRPICRSQQVIKKKVDGVETQATWQFEDVEADFQDINRFLRRAAKMTKVVRIAYLDDIITDPNVDGDVIDGNLSYVGQRNVGDKNVQITHENTVGTQSWIEYAAGGGTVTTGVVGDLPFIADTAGQLSPLAIMANEEGEVAPVEEELSGAEVSGETPTE